MLFKTQEEANQYFLKMEKVADQVCDEKTALKILEMIDVCYENQEEWFIPAIVMSYEEMALSYIPNDKAIKWVK